jgi:hypothetical protein
MEYSKTSAILTIPLAALLIWLVAACGGDDDGGTKPDTTPPTVIQTSPADNAQFVQISSVVTVTFSEAMEPSSLEDSALVFSPEVGGTVTYADRILTFTPDADLQANITYTATITTKAKDVAGNPIAQTYEWQFATFADVTPPQVSVVSPRDGQAVPDPATFDVAASDSGGVALVEFYLDGLKIADADDSTAPYQYDWSPAGVALGSSHELYAVAQDSSGNAAASDTVQFIYLWQILAVDADEGAIPRDIDSLMVRSGPTLIEFRVVTNGNWSDYKSPTEGIDLAVFFDVDQDQFTGQTTVSNGTIAINDIGAEYRLIVGNHGDVVDRWLPAPDSTWSRVGNVANLSIAADTNVFEVGVNRVAIGNPSTVDIVAADVILDLGLWDWAPNTGHITYMPTIFTAGREPSVITQERVAPDDVTIVSNSPFD